MLRFELLIAFVFEFVRDACAAEYGRADNGREYAEEKRGRHEPKAPALTEQHLLILNVKDKVPADCVEYQRENGGYFGADHKVKRKTVAEFGQKERQLGHKYEKKTQNVQRRAGTYERWRVYVETSVSTSTRVPQAHVARVSPHSRRYAHYIQHH